MSTKKAPFLLKTYVVLSFLWLFIAAASAETPEGTIALGWVASAITNFSIAAIISNKYEFK